MRIGDVLVMRASSGEMGIEFVGKPGAVRLGASLVSSLQPQAIRAGWNGCSCSTYILMSFSLDGLSLRGGSVEGERGSKFFRGFEAEAQMHYPALVSISEGTDESLSHMTRMASLTTQGNLTL